MIIKTASGNVILNKKQPYAKWLQGWIDGGGWTGHATLSSSWQRAKELKMSGVSWYCLGKLMASEQKFGRKIEAKEWQ